MDRSTAVHHSLQSGGIVSAYRRRTHCPRAGSLWLACHSAVSHPAYGSSCRRLGRVHSGRQCQRQRTHRLSNAVSKRDTNAGSCFGLSRWAEGQSAATALQPRGPNSPSFIQTAERSHSYPSAIFCWTKLLAVAPLARHVRKSHRSLGHSRRSSRTADQSGIFPPAA